MKKLLLDKFTACLLVACLCGTLFGSCKSVPITQVDITYFSFVHSDGWTMPDQYTIEETEEEILSLYCHPAPLEKPAQVVMTQPLQDELWVLLQRHELWRWNGFDKSIDAFDAPGFYLRIEFANGSSIEADGYGKFPKGYEAARQDIAAFFKAAAAQDKYS